MTETSIHQVNSCSQELHDRNASQSFSTNVKSFPQSFDSDGMIGRTLTPMALDYVNVNSSSPQCTAYCNSEAKVPSELQTWERQRLLSWQWQAAGMTVKSHDCENLNVMTWYCPNPACASPGCNWSGTTRCCQPGCAPKPVWQGFAGIPKQRPTTCHR